MSDHEVDYYVLLGIEYSASEKEIRKAYRIKSLTCHPDKVAATDTNAANLFQLINKAVDTLTDPLKKVKYDNIHKAERLHKKRMEEMDKERRFDREKLHQNEQEHERKRKDFNQSELDKIQINLIRENNILKMRAKQEIKRQEIISSISTVLQTKQMESKINSAEPFDCSVKIRFKKDDGSGKDRAKKDVDEVKGQAKKDVDEVWIRNSLSRYGPIDQVIRKEKYFVVVFKELKGCFDCLHDKNVGDDMKQFKMSFLGKNEPKGFELIRLLNAGMVDDVNVVRAGGLNRGPEYEEQTLNRLKEKEKQKQSNSINQ